MQEWRGRTLGQWRLQNLRYVAKLSKEIIIFQPSGAQGRGIVGWMLPPSLKVFFEQDFSLSVPTLFSSCMQIPYTHFGTWKSASMDTKWDVTSTTWTSHFLIEKYVFSLLFVKKYEMFKAATRFSHMTSKVDKSLGTNSNFLSPFVLFLTISVLLLPSWTFALFESNC